MMKKIIFCLLSAVLAASLSGCSALNMTTPGDPSELTGETWAPDVKTALNDFFRIYGKHGDSYDNHSYAVFDFDDTCSVFDVQDLTDYYRICTMAFAMDPAQLEAALSAGLSDLDADRSSAGFGRGSYADWISDIAAAYEKLYQTYGPFTAAGLDEEKQKTVQADPQWQEFAAKYLGLAATVSACEDTPVSLCRQLFCYTGMTEDEAYDLAKNCLSCYKDAETERITLVSPESVSSAVGAVSVSVTLGASVTENIVELFNAFAADGINTWICSASLTDTVRAAVDVYGLHTPLTGVLAMTLKKDDNGVYLSEYDYEDGCAWLAATDGSWVRDINPTCALTWGDGKVTAIDNVLVKAYGQGPIAGFMDSTGDFNFCTEYSSLKLAVCFNRADRKVTDGGGLIAGIAMYEKNTLGYTLESAAAAGDTLYLLQGRDENGLRTLRASNQTLRLGSDAEQLFANEDNDALLTYITENRLSVKDALETFAVKTAADDKENPLGSDCGFLGEYAGYHTK